MLLNALAIGCLKNVTSLEIILQKRENRRVWIAIEYWYGENSRTPRWESRRMLAAARIAMLSSKFRIRRANMRVPTMGLAQRIVKKSEAISHFKNL